MHKQLTPKRKKSIKQWHKFSMAITLVVLINLLAIAFIIRYFYIHYGVSDSISPFLVLILASMSIASVLTSIIAKIFMHPIDDISDAMIQVAEGDFSIQLVENDEFSFVAEMNTNFNKMVRELNSIEMLKTDFITNVSHEFKTPLASIQGYASLLNASELNEEQRGYAKNIMDSAARLTTLTGNILRLSKLENQQFNSEKKHFSLDEQIRQVILSMENSWTEKNIDIEPELESVDFLGFEELLPHVWYNLIGNAIKFTPEHGAIYIELHRETDGVSIAIRDTGIGMSETEIAHAFDKFYQADNNHSVSGNGLGLPLVKQIIGMHQGTIKIKSTPGYGSTFEIFLPNAQ